VEWALAMTARPHGGARPRTGPKPRPASELRKLVSLRLPRATVAALRELSEQTGASQSDVVAEAIRRWLDSLLIDGIW
jgi:uncharacterized protein YjiS (DUF1127 family)